MINNFCGEPPEGAELPQIKDGEIYIFNDDPNFNDLILYEQSGGIVTVRSWVECAHYVNGGWAPNIEIINSMASNRFYLTAIAIVFALTTFMFVKISLNKYQNG